MQQILQKSFFDIDIWTFSEHFEYISAKHLASRISNLQSAKSKEQSAKCVCDA